jgi:hypothetical protein
MQRSVGVVIEGQAAWRPRHLVGADVYGAPTRDAADSTVHGDPSLHVHTSSRIIQRSCGLPGNLASQPGELVSAGFS